MFRRPVGKGWAGTPAPTPTRAGQARTSGHIYIYIHLLLHSYFSVFCLDVNELWPWHYGTAMAQQWPYVTTMDVKVDMFEALQYFLRLQLGANSGSREPGRLLIPILRIPQSSQSVSSPSTSQSSRSCQSSQCSHS